MVNKGVKLRLSACTQGSDIALKEFMKRAETQGLTIQVVLQNGSNMNCILVLDINSRSLVIRNGEKMRVVPFNTIKNVLATPQQLARVDTQQDITNDPYAVGLHLYKTESCIPMRMESNEDKQNLIEMLKSFGIPPQKSKKIEGNQPAVN
ncbi:IMC sub-compartment protein ISP1 [Cyclospora cayetanensis]|uniref:IMC sub-compartment protein ISP1 n=1 Tax=Cyclospora cayetanensis TaxID=88456 RepID=A0A1D3D674_9EIME|nr:IMC sub-compartment protein ISP1 [Cyclospora cayetanensis]